MIVDDPMITAWLCKVIPRSSYHSMIIRGSVDKQEGASIRVNLIIEENSESETLSIERRWAENENGKIKEKVLILRKDTGRKIDG